MCASLLTIALLDCEKISIGRASRLCFSSGFRTLIHGRRGRGEIPWEFLNTHLALEPTMRTVFPCYKKSEEFQLLTLTGSRTHVSHVLSRYCHAAGRDQEGGAILHIRAPP